MKARFVPAEPKLVAATFAAAAESGTRLALHHTAPGVVVRVFLEPASPQRSRNAD